MKYFFYIILSFLCYVQVEAQTCLPDSTLKDSSAGVYPKPVSPTNPNGGITKVACINKPYEFVFTVVVPDTVQVPIFPNPIALEKVSIDSLGAILNLPEGISYSCNPPNCVFKKNTYGCLKLYGTPSLNNQAGDYKPIIKLKLTVNVGIPFDYTTEYPGPAFPGEYILKLVNEVDCASANKDLSKETSFWYPNPSFNGEFRMDSRKVSDIKVFNAHAKQIYTLNYFDGSGVHIQFKDYKEGIYFVQWREEYTWYNQKIILVNEY